MPMFFDFKAFLLQQLNYTIAVASMCPHPTATHRQAYSVPLTAAQLEGRNIKIYPDEKYTIAKGKYEESLIMGFGNVTEAQISEGIKTIAELL